MEMYIAADMPDRDPYWCEPWPSAVAMSAELLQRPDLVAGKRVCELGCGLGLAGLAAAVAGASRACVRACGLAVHTCAKQSTLDLPAPELHFLCALPLPGISQRCLGCWLASPLAATRLTAPTRVCPLLPEHAGAAEVVLLDREPLALQCALLNASLNGLPTAVASASGSGGGGGVQPPSLQQLLPHLQAADAAQLVEWQHLMKQQHLEQQQAGAAASSPATSSSSSSGDSSSDSNSTSSSSRSSSRAPGVVRAEQFDWSQPVTLQPHDVMLVCDCLYEHFSVQASPSVQRSVQSVLCRAVGCSACVLFRGPATC